MGFDDILTAIGAGVVIIVLLFVYVVAGTAIGALTGWVVSWTPLGKMVVKGLEILNLHAEGGLMAIGAMLGFVTGFFRGLITVRKE